MNKEKAIVINIIVFIILFFILVSVGSKENFFASYRMYNGDINSIIYYGIESLMIMAMSAIGMLIQFTFLIKYLFSFLIISK